MLFSLDSNFQSSPSNVARLQKNVLCEMWCVVNVCAQMVSSICSELLNWKFWEINGFLYLVLYAQYIIQARIASEVSV